MTIYSLLRTLVLNSLVLNSACDMGSRVCVGSRVFMAVMCVCVCARARVRARACARSRSRVRARVRARVRPRACVSG